MRHGTIVRLFTEVKDKWYINVNLIVDRSLDSTYIPDSVDPIEVDLHEIGPKLINARLDYATDLFALDPRDMKCAVDLDNLGAYTIFDWQTAIAVARAITSVRFNLGYLQRKLVCRSCSVSFKKTDQKLDARFGDGDSAYDDAHHYFDPIGKK